MIHPLCKTISILCVLIICFCLITPAYTDQSRIQIVVWSFTNELQEIIEHYYAPQHPEIQFSYGVFPMADNAYITTLDNKLSIQSSAMSDDAPDVFTLEAEFVKHYVQSDITGDLSDIGFSEDELSTEFPVVAQIGQNTVGVQKGLSWEASVGVLFYRASLAEKYLGITSPEEMQTRVNDWDSFLETAEELNEQSEGCCKMVTGTQDLWKAYQYFRNNGWIVNGELSVDETLLDYEIMCKTMEQDDLTQKADNWGETWFAGMRGEIETLCYFLPSWGLHNTLKPNCVAGWDYDNPDSEENVKNAMENGTYGDWRMTIGPNSFNWGGTWIGTNAAKMKVVDNTKKRAIHDLLYFLTLDTDFLTQYAADTGNFVGNAAAAEEIIALGGKPNPFLGGQDYYQLFATAASLTDGSLMSEYDEIINALWNEYVTTPYTHNEKDLETCIEDFRDAVTEWKPDFPIPTPDYPKKLSLSIFQNGYHEDFSSNAISRYFVMALNTEATLSLSAISFNGSYSYTVACNASGDAIRIDEKTIHAVNSGISTITAWIVSDGEEVDESRKTANIIVIDPQKTVVIPHSVEWLESEAFRGIKAECIIIPGDIWVIESNCFANCPNLKTVIWTGDPSGTRVMTPFSSVNSVLFLSADGQMPRGLNAVNTGITNFSGFHGETDIRVTEIE